MPTRRPPPAGPATRSRTGATCRSPSGSCVAVWRAARSETPNRRSGISCSTRACSRSQARSEETIGSSRRMRPRRSCSGSWSGHCGTTNWPRRSGRMRCRSVSQRWARRGSSRRMPSSCQHRRLSVLPLPGSWCARRPRSPTPPRAPWPLAPPGGQATASAFGWPGSNLAWRMRSPFSVAGTGCPSAQERRPHGRHRTRNMSPLCMPSCCIGTSLRSAQPAWAFGRRTSSRRALNCEAFMVAV
mmetsp:Transcript_125751/g.363785  ORF Transcript_125751/g.363785 Transcript_125751/m.363785 type:complete len:243 (-) Transcript_125751:1003-1731(-)